MLNYEERIWSVPLTENERNLALKAFLLGSNKEASQWGNFLLKICDAQAAEVARLRTALEQADAALVKADEVFRLRDDAYGLELIAEAREALRAQDGQPG